MNRAAVPSLTIGIPCRVNEPRLDVTLESLLVACRHLALPTTLGIEIVICINGWQGEEACPPLAAALQVSERAAIPLRQYDITATRPPDDSPPLSISVLCWRRLGKAIAWNAIRRWTASDLVIFCDADVRLGAEAVAALYTTLQSSPEAQLVASNEIPAVTAQDTWLRHAAALPYRFYFHNVTGRLYIIDRKSVV